MKAGILAAGDGSRLVAAGIVTPKPLVKIGGLSLIERTLRALVDGGADEIAFVVNERMDSVVDAVRALRLPVPVHPVIQTTPSSMHSLHALAPWLKDDRFVLCTVDSVMRTDEFCDFMQFHAVRTEFEVLLSYTDFVDDENPLRIGLDGEDRVVALGPYAKDSPFVTLGLYGMSPSIFPLLERAVGEGEQRLRNFLARLLSAGFGVHGRRISKGVDVDRVVDVQIAEAFLLEQRARP
jgi:NDP-sugar pyrophosphorylase family protein